MSFMSWYNSDILVVCFLAYKLITYHIKTQHKNCCKMLLFLAFYQEDTSEVVSLTLSVISFLL